MKYNLSGMLMLACGSVGIVLPFGKPRRAFSFAILLVIILPTVAEAQTTWNGTTWSSGAPTSSVDAIIASSITPGAFTCQNLTINSGFALTTTAGVTTTIHGDITNGGDGIAGSGPLVFAKAGTQAISGNSLSIYGRITVNSGATLTTNDKLILASSASSTGSIGNSAGTISGNVTVQRYIPGGRRAFRFLSNPFTTSQPLSVLTDDIDITGAGGATNGFTPTVSNNPSALWYNVANANGSSSNDPGWTAFTNTDGIGTNAWPRYGGLTVLVRGAIGEGLNGLSYTPSAVTLDMTGTLNQGSQVVPVTDGPNSIYAFVGNPFYSPIDMSLVTRGGNIATFYYYWDANIGVRGGYTAKLYTTSFVLPAGTGFITGIASSSTITFNESCKSSAAPYSIFKTTAAENTVQLKITGGKENVDWDVLQLYFNNSGTHDSEANDAPKFANPDFNFYSLSGNGSKLAIDMRPYVNGEVIALGIEDAPQNTYKLVAEEANMPSGTSIYLRDKYLNKTMTVTPGFSYSFTVSADPLSQGSGRFELRTSGDPIAPTSISAIASTLPVSLSPNPAVSILNVAHDGIVVGKEITVRVRNMNGAMVSEYKTTANRNGTVQISVANLAAGVYLAELTNNGQVAQQKFVKE